MRAAQSTGEAAVKAQEIARPGPATAHSEVQRLHHAAGHRGATARSPVPSDVPGQTTRIPERSSPDHYGGHHGQSRRPRPIPAGTTDPALPALPIMLAAVMLGSATDASAAPPNSDKASCVEQFNLAAGTAGEYQSVFHQAELGRDVSSFATLPKEECPFERLST